MAGFFQYFDVVILLSFSFHQFYSKTAVNTIIADVSFPLLLWDLLFVVVFQQFYYYVLRCDFIGLYPAWCSWRILNLWLDIFHQFWKMLSHYYSNITYALFSLSSPRTLISPMIHIFILSHNSLTFFHHFLSF